MNPIRFLTEKKVLEDSHLDFKFIKEKMNLFKNKFITCVP